MKNSYGDKVEVKYVDTDKTGFDNYPLVRRVLQMGYNYPITIINGEPKFAGGIMEREINNIVDELIK
jgi:disulfide oxidoreductase YuzD